MKSSRPELSFSLKFVQYAQSGKVKSSSDSSVSYASASLTVSTPPWPYNNNNNIVLSSAQTGLVWLAAHAHYYSC